MHYQCFIHILNTFSNAAICEKTILLINHYIHKQNPVINDTNVIK